MQFDEWGKPPSLADVPLTYGPRKEALKRAGLSEKEMENYYKEYLKEKDD